MKMLNRIGILLFVFAAIVSAQDQAEMMKRWQDYMAPSVAHKEFEKLSGTWNAEITQYMNGQEAKATGTAVYEVILGGRYVKGSFKSTMMGMPMEGFSLDAFDNGSKEYISIWVDNFGTGVMIMKGKKDPATNKTVLTGEMYEPTANKNIKMKTVTTQIDDNKINFEMFMLEGGQEIKSMQIVYTRVK